MNNIITNDATNGNAGCRVRVQPGSVLSVVPKQSALPTTPPPKPSHLCKIAIVGDAKGGKSSLVQKFIYRRYANGGSHDDNNIVNSVDGRGDATWCNEGASATDTFHSVGTSTLGTHNTATEGLVEPTLADYYKKDVTIWDVENEVDNNEQTPVCIRVQVWDINIHKQHHQQQQQGEPEQPDLISCSQSISSALSSPRQNATNIAPLLPLLKRVNGIVIVCRCPLPPSTTNISSNASYVSYASNNISCSEWPELDTIEQQIHRWTTFLNDKIEEGNDEKQQQRPSTFLLLSFGDIAVGGYSPREWTSLSIRMQEICKTYNIHSWKIGTCMDTSSSTLDLPQQQNQQSQLLQRMMVQQNQILEDIEDGIEAGFIELISMHLHRSREIRKQQQRIQAVDGSC